MAESSVTASDSSKELKPPSDSCSGSEQAPILRDTVEEARAEEGAEGLAASISLSSCASRSR